MPRLPDQLGTVLRGTPFSFDAALTPFFLFVSGRSVRRRQVMRVLTRRAAAMLLIAAGLLLVPAANAKVQWPFSSLSNQAPAISHQQLHPAAAALDRVLMLK